MPRASKIVALALLPLSGSFVAASAHATAPFHPTRELLPRVEYSGGARSDGVPDLRLGVLLRSAWVDHLLGLPSRMTPLPPAELPPKNQQFPVKKFVFVDGVIVCFIPELSLVAVSAKNGISLFRWRAQAPLAAIWSVDLSALIGCTTHTPAPPRSGLRT